MSGGLGEYGRCGGVCSETVRCGGLRKVASVVVWSTAFRAVLHLHEVAWVVNCLTGAGVTV
jgi:hypothetical protein